LSRPVAISGWQRVMQGPISIWVFFGLIASGKSTLAEKWADRHQLAHFNSDRIRKELAGLAPTADQQEFLDKGIYSSEFSRRTYDELLTRAERECKAGRSTILDASYQSRSERQKVRALADRLGVDLFFVLCNCPEGVTMERLAIRSRDPEAVSDGRPEIYRRQKERFSAPDELGNDELFNLSTLGPVADLLDQLDRIFEVDQDA
jgi:predicted kinase